MTILCMCVTAMADSAENKIKHSTLVEFPSYRVRCEWGQKSVQSKLSLIYVIERSS